MIQSFLNGLMLAGGWFTGYGLAYGCVRLWERRKKARR